MLVREPKYGHLTELHKAIKLCEKALVYADPTVTALGSYEEVSGYHPPILKYFLFFLPNVEYFSIRPLVVLPIVIGVSGPWFFIPYWRLCSFSFKLQFQIICKSFVQ